MRKILSVLIIVLILIQNTLIGTNADACLYRNGNRESKQIALTFDDGPHPKLTPRILEILHKYGVVATFFEIGENVEQYPEAAKAVADAGHEIGNHTYSHSHVRTLSEEKLAEEIEKCKDSIQKVCGCSPSLLRPPEGAVNSSVISCAEKGGYRLILWSIDTRDWERKNAPAIAKEVLSLVRGGDIILMHDFIGSGSQTPEALEIILPQLIKEGYEFVTVSRLIRDS